MHNGIDQKTANQIFDDIEHFGGYGFNRSHSAAYSYIAYQCAYLKTYHPLEFMCNLLTSEIHNSDSGKRLLSYTSEARRMGIKISGVNINRSKVRYVVEDRETEKDGKTVVTSFIRTPLTVIKGVGEKAVDEIVAHQPFKNLYDFISRVDNRKVTSKVFESLVHAGCMDDEWNLSKEEILGRVDEIRATVKAETKQQQKAEKYVESFGGSMFDII
jgi:DNA polymerase-3 subunit alpha